MSDNRRHMVALILAIIISSLFFRWVQYKDTFFFLYPDSFNAVFMNEAQRKELREKEVKQMFEMWRVYWSQHDQSEKR